MSLIKFYATKWLSTIILRKSPLNVKNSFRNLEKLKLKIVKLECHRSFNETCVINELLPTYTNVRLHDEAASTETFVSDFRKKLVERQIFEQSESISSITSDYHEALAQFRTILNSDLRYNAFLMFLDRISRRVRDRTSEIQHNKLVRMYGSGILQKQNKDSVVNLSSIEIDDDMKNIFSLGMNCHLRQKFNHIKKRVNVELLYDRISDLSSSKKICIFVRILV